MRRDDCPDLTCFLRGERDPAGFTHREHVRMAFELLRRHEFAESLLPHWYRPERLASAAAHRMFLMPDPAWGDRAALPD